MISRKIRLYSYHVETSVQLVRVVWGGWREGRERERERRRQRQREIRSIFLFTRVIYLSPSMFFYIQPSPKQGTILDLIIHEREREGGRERERQRHRHRQRQKRRQRDRNKQMMMMMMMMMTDDVVDDNNVYI